MFAAALALGACGSSEPAAEPPRDDRPTTRLVVELLPGSGPLAPGDEPSRRTIECPGHELCARLADVPRSAFDPVPDNVACTAIYGGPQTATVEGRLRGEPLEARFSKRNGCEISRWERLEWLLER